MLLVCLLAIPITNSFAQAPATCEECNNDQFLIGPFCYDGNSFCPSNGNPHTLFDTASEACLVSKGCIPIDQNHWILIVLAVGIVVITTASTGKLKKLGYQIVKKNIQSYS